MSDTLTDTILDTNTSTGSTPKTDKATRPKAASFPAIAVPSEGLVKPQLSAPSYFHSLRENNAPPFRARGKEPYPRLIIGNIMTEADTVAMIFAADNDKENGLRKYLGNFLVEKEIIVNYNISEKNFLISLLMETIDYAAERKFDGFKLAVLLTIYLDSHLYFKCYYWQSPVAVWNYFREMMLSHTIEDSPDGEEVFRPEDCYDIITHFHTVYLSNLPLIHILTFGSYRLKLLWPFKLK